MENMALARDEEEITQNNYPSSISCLPSEMLATIFIHRASDYHSRRQGCPTLTVPSWVNVSYVCHQWRHVALNCPTLWTYVFITSQRWTEELLARSKQASLKVRARLLRQYDDPLWLNMVEKVMVHMERIQELCLDLSIRGSHQFLSVLSSRAPRLQNLKISVNGVSMKELSLYLDGDTPALRTLELSYCPMPWYTFKLSGLTILSLNCTPSRFQKTTEDFLAMLSCMPDLTRLYLDRSLPSATGLLSSTAFHTFQRIDLPHLSRLLIAAPSSTVIALLSCVNIPLNTEVRLKCDSEGHSSLDDYVLLTSLLAQRFRVSENQALSSPVIRSLAIGFGEEGATITLSASECDYNFSLTISHHEWDRNIPLKVIVNWGRAMRSNGDRIVSDVCRCMPLTNVRSVHVRAPPFSRAFWRRTLVPLQDLRYIKLSHGNMPDLASELSFPTHEGAEGQDGLVTGDQGRCHVLAPRLEEFELHRITFSQGGNPGLAIPEQDLINALSTRQGLQGHFTMTQCKITGDRDRADYVLTAVYKLAEDGSDAHEEDDDRISWARRVLVT